MITLSQSANQQCIILFWGTLKKANKETKACRKILFNIFTGIKYFPKKESGKGLQSCPWKWGLKRRKLRQVKNYKRDPWNILTAGQKARLTALSPRMESNCATRAFQIAWQGWSSDQFFPQRRWKCSIHSHSFLLVLLELSSWPLSQTLLTL